MAFAGERPAGASVWGHGAGAAVGAGEPLALLDPGAPPRDEPLALMGAERLALSDALSAWSHARDEAANRLWRRPGGLARLAGL